MEDRELLREYIERHSEQAFTELVARHVNLVYSTALRIVGDAQMAQDVAQAAFISLARKAGSLRDHDALGGWLYRASHNAAASLLGAEQRRRQREAQAVNLAELNAEPHAAWEAIRPLLEAAMRQLKPAEQDALILRYYQGQSLRQAGETLGVTEDAVQKRISRALEKLRTHFARKGVVVSAAVLATALSGHAVQAVPSGLAAALASSSLAGAGSAAASTPVSILKLLVMTKVQAATLGLLFVAGVATPLTISHLVHWGRPGASAPNDLAAGATDPGLAAPDSVSPGTSSPTNAPADSPALSRLRVWMERADRSRVMASREEEIRRLVRALAPSDFPQAWTLWGGLKSRPLRTRLGNFLLAPWAAKDGPAAIAAAQAVPDKAQRNSFLDSAVCAWAKTSPSEALAWIKSFYAENEQVPKLMLVFYGCADQNPQAARALWQQLPPGLLRDSAASTFIDALAEQDAPAAVACLKEIGSSSVRDSVRSAILRQWAETDAAAAFAWAQSQPRLRDRDDGIDVVINTLRQQNPAQAAEMLKALSPLEVADDHGMDSDIISQWASEDLPAATLWTKQLPVGPLRDQAYEGLLTSAFERSAPEAAALAQALPESPTQSKLLNRVAFEWAFRDAKAVLSWLETLPDGPARSAVLTGYAEGLALQKPEQAARFVAALPAGDLQAEAALQVINRWAENDPPSAAAWAEAFPAGATRDQALAKVASQWLGADRSTAEAWLEKTTLPAETKAKLLHK